MIATTFNSGNFNDWDLLVSNTLPAKNIILRQEIIPTIDKVLLTMLGPGAQIEKKSIDVTEVCSRNSLIAVQFKLIYIVKDFNVPEAPKAAIEKDTQTLVNALFREDFKLLDLSIDVNSGQLTITYEAPLMGD